MKYYSYIDQHNLDIEGLINLSPYKLGALLSELNNLKITNKTLIISGLEDSVSRSYHVAIEKNSWLKMLLNNEFDKVGKSSIELNLESIGYIYGFKMFLELYLRPIIPYLLEYFIKKNELKPLFKILSQSDIFSDACVDDIKTILNNKISYATNYLSKELSDKNVNDSISYIKSYHFYEILNLYKPHLDNPTLKLYDTIIEVKSKFDTNTVNQIARFISQAQVAFNKSQVDDVATKLLIDDNAENEINYAYDYSSETTINPGTSSFNIYASISAIIVIIIIIFTVVFYEKQDSYEDLVPNQTESTKKKKRTTYDNRIRFYYSLKRITKKAKTNEVFSNYTEIIPFSNPYPKTFNKIHSDTIASKHNNVQISNKTGSDLIIFKMIKGKDESIYIPKDKAIFISVNPLDSLLFYSGNRFETSKLSHFSENTFISDIYKVSEIGNASVSTINITPIDSLSNSKNRTLPQKNINTSNNIELNEMNLDNLYRIYYSNYAN